MKKSRYSKMALAAILGVALIQASPALAKKNKAVDDENLSVKEWGPWGTMGTPAAGPEQVAAIIDPNVAAANFRDNQAQVAQVIPPADEPPPVIPPVEPPPVIPPEPPPVVEVGPCTAGAPCGWTAEESRSWTETWIPPYNYGDGYGDGYGGGYTEYSDWAEGALALARFEISVPGLNDAINSDAGEGSIEGASFIVHDPIFNHPEHPRLERDNLSGWWYNYGGFMTDPDGVMTEIYLQGETSETTLQAVHLSVPAWELDVMVGVWNDTQVDADTPGVEKWTVRESWQNDGPLPFVYGTTSTQTALDNLQSGNVVINYSGSSLMNGTPITMFTVDFGNQKWDASFNNGSDGKVYVSSSNNVYGHVGFNASGHLAGPNLITDSLSAVDGAIDPAKSTLQGAVFGNAAQAVAGGYEIVKTRTDGTYTDGQHADVFIALDSAKFQTPQ